MAALAGAHFDEISVELMDPGSADRVASDPSIVFRIPSIGIDDVGDCLIPSLALSIAVVSLEGHLRAPI